MTDLQPQVQGVYDLLDEQIAEMDWERKGELNVELFFDARDVRYAIFGLPNLYDGHRFSTELFRSDAAMVQGLGYAGWLGKMRMLQPHQSELLTALYKPLKRRTKSWEAFVSEFLQEISY